MEPARLLRDARRAAGLSQRELARRAGTSGPTVAAYESARVEPRLSTLERLLAAAGLVLRLTAEEPPPLTREERRSLFLHQAVAEHLRARPRRTLAAARRNLRTMRRADTAGAARRWLDAWEGFLRSGDADVVAAVLTDATSPLARELRQNSPFAGVLSPHERWARYREFRSEEPHS